MIPTVITGRNADLIAAAGELYIKPDDLVLDVTYGKGNFWKKYRPANLVCHDLAIDGVDFRQLPEDDASIDVIVFDPPYMSTGNQATSTIPGFYSAFGLGGFKGWQQCFDLIAAGMKEDTRVVRPGGLLWVKCCDFVESGHKRWGHDHVVNVARDLNLTKIDEFILHKGPGPQPARRQVHAHNAHSFLIVFRR